MAGHLIKKGYEVSVFNRTKSKTDNLVEKGAYFKTPSCNTYITLRSISLIEIAKDSDVLALMLGYPSDLRDVTTIQSTNLVE